MKLLVTGRHGQVARALAPYGAAFIARPELDLADTARLSDAIARALEREQPDVLVSAAAWTDVDGAESEPDLAHAVNAVAPGILAVAAAAHGVPVIHLSTDYVFDGQLGSPYRPDDPVSPLGAYGRSKAAGEEAVREASPVHAILRTAWLHSPHGANFVRTMLRFGKERDEVAVVADAFGNPTAAADVAAGIVRVAAVLVTGPHREPHSETHHLVSRGAASWADLAEHVLRGTRTRVRRIAAADYPTRAPRPRDTRLDGTSFEKRYGLVMPDWRAGVDRTLAALNRGSDYTV